jgi:thioredoxin reductase (NADPH)
MTRPLKNLCEIAVIGGGLAGLSAARHAARLGRLVTLFEGTGLCGGQVATVGEVSGLPFAGEHSGQDLAIHLFEEAKKVGCQMVEAGIAQIAFEPRLELIDEHGVAHYPEAVIVASGASLKMLGVPGEEEFYGRGVSRCATCDSGFFRNQDVAVIGGGDAAFHEALVLAKVAREVIMVCRSSARAKREYIDTLDARVNVRFVWDHEVAAIGGDASGVTGLTLRHVQSGAESSLECTGVFPFIGVKPNTGFLPADRLAPSGQVRHDVAAPLFACGAARQGCGGTATEVMADGISAAEAAARFLRSR